MSLNELRRFSDDVNSNEQLKNELKNLGNDEDAIVKFAQGKGYDVSKEDIKNLESSSDELTDTDLDKAAGGDVAIYHKPNGHWGFVVDN